MQRQYILFHHGDTEGTEISQRHQGSPSISVYSVSLVKLRLSGTGGHDFSRAVTERVGEGALAPEAPFGTYFKAERYPSEAKAS